MTNQYRIDTNCYTSFLGETIYYVYKNGQRLPVTFKSEEIARKFLGELRDKIIDEGGFSTIEEIEF